MGGKRTFPVDISGLRPKLITSNTVTRNERVLCVIQP